MQNSLLRDLRKAVLSFLALCVAMLLATPPHASDADYVLGAGDKVRITVFGETDLTGEYEIDGSGVVAFPLVGEVPASGGTARHLEKALAAKLRDGYLKNPTISIEVLTYRPFFIMGEVKRPGSYPYRNGLTALSAVAMAGGYTYRAKSSIWVITRSGDKAEREITDGSFRILPGDTILIPERFF